MSNTRSDQEFGNGFRRILDRCSQQTRACAQACDAVVAATLRDDRIELDRRSIRVALDCADLCKATAALATRASDVENASVLRLLETCAQAAEACAVECERVSVDYTMQCASTCRRCEEACRLTMQEIGGESGLVQTN